MKKFIFIFLLFISFHGINAQGTIDFTDASTSTSVTSTNNGVTVTVTLSEARVDGAGNPTDSQIVVGSTNVGAGTSGNYLLVAPNFLKSTTTMTFTFSQPVSISSFRFAEVTNHTVPNFVFTPSSGTTLNLSSGDVDLSGITVSSGSGLGNLNQISTWTNISSFTITYTGADVWSILFDTIVFGVANNPPEVDLNGGSAGTNNTATFTVGGSPVRFAPSATITDANSAFLVSLTASLSSIPDGANEGISLTGDAFGVTGGMNISYDSGTGVLTCTGSKSVADYQTLLQNLTYYNLVANPDQTNRIITVVLNDGTNNSTARTSTVPLVTPNNAPEVDLNGGGDGNDNSASFTEGSGGVEIAPSGTVTDGDGDEIQSMIVTVTNDLDGASESLTLNSTATTAAGNDADVSVTAYNSGTGVLSISGAGTAATYQTILQGILYNNTENSPDETARSITVVVNDGTDNSTSRTSTISVADVTSATSTAAGFNTTDGTNLNPAIVYGSGNETLTIGNASHLTGSTANGQGGTDVLSVPTGTNLSLATSVSNFENLTLASGATVTMTLSQLSGFTGTITAAGNETLNLSGDGNFSTISNIENYSFGDASTNSRTITVTNAGHSVSAASTTDAITFDLGALAITGSFTGEGTVNDVISIGNGSDLSGGTISNIEDLTLTSGASVTMTTAQLNGFSGTITAAGSETITLTSAGTLSGSNLGAIETIGIKSGNGNQTVTLSAANADGKTLNNGDAGDNFTVTGSAGAQTINGSGGGDDLSGGDGDDIIKPGAGTDSMTGGNNNDEFTGSAADLNGDTIADLTVGDKVRLTGVTGLSTANMRFNGTGTLEIDVNATTFASPEVSLTLSNNPGNDLDFTVQDDAGTTLVTLIAANNTPVLDNTKSPVLTSIVEDLGAPTNGSTSNSTLVSAIIDNGGALDNYSDGDGDSPGIAVTAVSQGTLYYSVNGGTNWTALGAVNASSALVLIADANTRVYFKPDANIGGAVADAITIKAWDRTVSSNGSTGVNTSSNAFSTATDDVSVSITEINDPPTLTATGQNPTYIEGGAGSDLYNAVSASTVEGTQNVVELRLTVTNVSNGSSEVLSIDGTDIALIDDNSGTTTNNSLSVTITVPASTATVTITKGAGVSAATLQTIVDGIQYKNTSENPSTGSNRVVTLTYIKDNGGTANSGDDDNALTISSTVTLTAVNDPPDVSNLFGDNTSEVTAGGGAQNITDFDDATVTNADSPDYNGGFLTISQGSGTANGSYGVVGTNATSGGDATISAGETIAVGGTSIGTVHATNDGQGGNTLQISFNTANATSSRIQTLIRNLTYTAPSVLGARVFTLTLDDNDGTANGGDEDAAGSFTITVTPNPPVLNNIDGDNATIPVGGATGNIDVDDNATVTDADSPNFNGGNLTITQNTGTANGNFSLGGSGAGEVLSGSLLGNADGTIAGSETIYVEGVAIASVSAADNGQSGNNLVINFGSNATPARAQSLLRTLQYAAPSGTGDRTFTISLQDAAANFATGTANITITMTPPEMDLKQGATAIADGGSYNFGTQALNGNKDVIFTIENTGNGTLALTTPITLGGADAGQFSIQQQPTSPVTSGNTTTFTVRFTPTTTGSKTASISITNNDSDENPYDFTITGSGGNPPTGGNDDIEMKEDSEYTFSSSDFTFNDADGDAFAGIQIQTIQTKGNLKYNETNVASGLDCLNLGLLKFTPDSEESGSNYATFTFKVKDDNGAYSTSSYTMTINVLSVNDQPSFTADNPPAVFENAQQQSIENWAIFDAGPENEDAVQSVQEYSVFNVTNPDLFQNQPSVDTDGTLTYTLKSDANGSSLFSVKVRDDGGIENGGVDTSDAQEFVISVEAVNNAPTFAADEPAPVMEDAGMQTIENWAVFNAGSGDEELTQSVDHYTVLNITNDSLFSALPTVDADGTLTFTSAEDANGISTFDLYVKDNGGTANGGVDTSSVQQFTITVSPVNDAPSITAEDPPVSREDSGEQIVENWIQFSAGPTDEDTTQNVKNYTVSNISNPELFAVSPAVSNAGDLSYTTADNVNGTSTFDVAVQDDGGTENGGIDSSVVKTFTITVRNVNDPPTTTGIPNISVLEDAESTVIDLSKYYDDPDQSPKTLSYTVEVNTNPALFSSITIEDYILTINYAANKNGSGYIQVRATDDEDGRIETTINISIKSVNDAPVTTDIADLIIPEDSKDSVIVLSQYFSDVENDAMGLNYTIEEVSNPGLFNSLVIEKDSLMISFLPNMSGESEITLKVFDKESAFVETKFKITVQEVNDPPVITGIPLFNINEDTELTIKYSDLFEFVSDEESGPSELELKLTGTENLGISLETADSVVCVPLLNWSGVDSLILVVSDGELQTEGFVVVEVTEVNDAPEISFIPEITTDEDLEFTIRFSQLFEFVNDVETASSDLSYEITGSDNISKISGDQDSTVFKPATNWSGTDTLNLVVSDGLLNSEGEIIVTVLSVNDPPIITAIPPLSFDEDDSLKVTSSSWGNFVEDPETPDKELIYSVTGGTNVIAANPNDSTALFTSSFNWFGVDTLTLSVSDGELSTQQRIIVRVISINDLPVFTNMPDTIDACGSEFVEFNLWDNVSDVESRVEDLKFEFSASSDTLTVLYDSTSGVLNLSTPRNFAGDINLSITVTDSDNGLSAITTVYSTCVITSLRALDGLIPDDYLLEQNYPNPFNPTTTIRYGLPEESNVKVMIYNLLGQLVTTLTDEVKKAGYYEDVFDAGRLASGIYLVSIYSESTMSKRKFTTVKKMMLVK